MNDQIVVRRIVVDLAANSILLQTNVQNAASDAIATETSLAGTLDIGRRGRLLGIELRGEYFIVSPPEFQNDDLVRSRKVAVTTKIDRTGAIREISLPRRGPNHEISYPIGNSCWQHATVDGRPVESCVITLSRR